MTTTEENENMDGYVPCNTAAQIVGYTRSYVGRLARNGQVPAKEFYGRTLVHLESVRALKTRMELMGTAKFTPKHHRRHPAKTPPEEVRNADA